jgi:hypothetical protein
MVECLPSKCEALNPNPGPPKININQPNKQKNNTHSIPGMSRESFLHKNEFMIRKEHHYIKNYIL